LSDFVADHSSVTPTAAGYHIKEQYNNTKKQWVQLENLNKKIFYLKQFSAFLVCLTLISVFYSSWVYQNNQNTKNVSVQMQSSISKKSHTHYKITKKAEENKLI